MRDHHKKRREIERRKKAQETQKEKMRTTEHTDIKEKCEIQPQRRKERRVSQRREKTTKNTNHTKEEWQGTEEFFKNRGGEGVLGTPAAIEEHYTKKRRKKSIPLETLNDPYWPIK